MVSIMHTLPKMDMGVAVDAFAWLPPICENSAPGRSPRAPLHVRLNEMNEISST